MALRPNAQVNRHNYVRGFVIIVLVLTGLLFFWPIIKYSMAIANMYSSQSVITIGLTLHEIDENDIPKLNLNVWENQYLARQEVPLSLVSVDYIYVPEDLISDRDSLCISELKIVSDFTLGRKDDVIYLVSEKLDENAGQQNICFAGGKNVILPKHFQLAPIVYSEYHNPFFYPFDSRTINYSLSSRLYFKSTGDNLDPEPKILMSVSPPNWIANTDIISRSEKENSLSLRTVLYRSPFVKMLSIIVPLSILLIIFVLPKIKEVGSFLQVIVGLILGLWGLSEVLIPSYVNYPTIIEALILSFYAIISLFVIRFVGRQILQRDKPLNSLSGEIPDNESIETLFAWAIEKLNGGVESTKIAEALFVKARNVNSASYKKKLIEVGEKFIKP